MSIIITTSKDLHAAYLTGGADGIETTEAGIYATSFKAFPRLGNFETV